jgi:hypothetical protein
VPEAPASPPPNPTPSIGAVLSEAEAEESVQEEMVASEVLPWFGPGPFLEGTLPEEGEARLPSMAEAPALTVGAGPSTWAQEAMKESMPKGPSAQMGSTAGGGSRVDDIATSGPGTIEGEVVSISSDKPSDMAEVAQSSGARGSVALVLTGHDPF